jgi:hypothetical protein
MGNTLVAENNSCSANWLEDRRWRGQYTMEIVVHHGENCTLLREQYTREKTVHYGEYSVLWK